MPHFIEKLEELERVGKVRSEDGARCQSERSSLPVGSVLASKGLNSTLIRTRIAPKNRPHQYNPVFIVFAS